MKELILVRHGEAEHIVKKLTGGWTNLPLTDKGRMQARLAGERLAELLKGHSFGFFCSDLKRAAETASIISSRIGAQPRSMHCLREFNNGIAANQSLEQARAIQRAVTHPLIDWFPFPESENWRMLYNRVSYCLTEIENSTGDTALIVAHGGVIITIIQWWLEFPEELLSKVSFHIDLCSITHLTINKLGEKTLIKLNDTCHLHGMSTPTPSPAPFPSI